MPKDLHLSDFFCTFATTKVKRKEAIMKTSANQYERMTVHVPRVESRRFRAIVKALGFEIEKKNAIDRALDDIEAGRVRTFSSANEMYQALGI